MSSNLVITDYKQAGIIYSQASRPIKFGFLCTNRESLPKWFGFLCFFIFKLETFAMLGRVAMNYLKNDSPGIESVIKVYVNILTWTNWLSTGSSGPTIAMCILIFVYILSICSMAAYLNLKLYFKTIIPLYAQFIWSLMCYFHPLVFFLPIHTFCLEALKRASDDAYTEGMPIVYLVLFYLSLAINFVLAFGFINIFYVIIKNKDPLACKNNLLKFKDICMKGILPIIALFAEDIEGLQIFLMFVVIFDAITRDITLFYYLPYYRINVLVMLALMQGCLTPLSITILATKLLSYTKLDLGIFFATMTWLLISPISIRLYHLFLWRLFIRIVESPPSKLSIYHMLHKRILLKHFLNKRILPHADTYKVSIFHYLTQAKLSNLAEKYNQPIDEIDYHSALFGAASKGCYLEVARNHPKSSLAKANLAQFYVQKEGTYLLANTLIEEVLSKSPSFATRVSLSLIRFQLQKKLYLEYSNHGQDEVQTRPGSGLNILQFVRSTRVNDKLKAKIKSQVKVQLEFWQKFASVSTPDFGELVNLAFKINKSKANIHHTWRELVRVKSPQYIYPYLLYGMYISLANNDAAEGEKYTEVFNKETSKTNKMSQVDDMNNFTLFCENTVQLSMAGSKKKLGKILDCSSNMSSAFGWKREFLIDRSINILMSPYYASKHDRFLVHHYNTGRSPFINTTHNLPVQNSDGFLTMSWVHVKMNPIVEQGISYLGVMRPMKYPSKTVCIRKNGEIDSVTQDFAEEMNLVGVSDLTQKKIFTYCPDFRPVNAAFNNIMSKTLQDKLSLSAEGDLRSMESHYDQNSNHYNDFGGEILRTNSDKESSPPTHANRRKISSDSTHYQETENKHQAIFDRFTEGSALLFYPQKKFSVEGNKIKIFADDNHVDDAQPIQYHVRILTRVYEKELLKILILERPVEKERPLEEDYATPFQQYHPRKVAQAESQFYIPEKDEEQIESKPELQSQIASPKFPMSYRPPLTSDSRALIMSPKNDHGTQNLLTPNNYRGDLPLSTEMSHTVNTHSLSNIPDEIDEDQDNKQILPYRNKEADGAIPEEEDDLALGKTSVLTFGKNSVNKQKFAQVVCRARKLFYKPSSSNSGQNHSHEERLKDPKQEENFLRTKLKRLRERLNKGMADAHRMQERSVSSSYLSKGRKVQTLITEALTMVVHRRSTIAFSVGFFVFILIVLALQIFQAINIFTAIDDIQKKTSVVEEGAFKLNSLLMIYFYNRLLDSSYKGEFTLYQNVTLDAIQLRHELNIYTEDLYEYNNYLMNRVSDLNEEYQTVFYQKDVRIYETEDNQLNQVSLDSNFEAITKIISHCVKTLATAIPTSYIMQTSDDIAFVLDNTLNDLLVSSEYTMDLLNANLHDTLDNVDLKVLVIYLLVIASVVLFFGVTANFLYRMRFHAFRFSSFFCRLETKETDEIRAHLQHFASSIDNMRNFEIPEEIKEKPEVAKIGHIAKTHFKQPLMGKFYKAQILVVSRLAPFYLLVIGWTLGYYLNIRSIVSNITKHEDQIKVSLDTLYSQNLIITEIIAILLTNNTVQVRNLPATEDFLSNINDLPSSATFVNYFREDDGSLSVPIQEAFYGFPCAQLIDYELWDFEYINNSCYTMSQGTYKVSLVETLSLMYSTTTEYYKLYQSSSKTHDELLDINSNFTAIIKDLGAVSPALCTILYQITVEDFNKQIDSANANALAFTIVSIIALAIGTLNAWFFVISKIFEFEGSDRQVLKLVPSRIILANRYLKQYLIHNSGGKLEMMKHLL